MMERMTEAFIRTVVEAIHSSPYQAVLYLAGGASQVFFPSSPSLFLSLCFFDARVAIEDDH